MIIQILSNLFEEGYLPREKYSALYPFFAGANVAFRRKALAEIGGYDTNCNSGEDQDVCLRIARAGWELYFEPKAVIRHKNKMTIKGFGRKWFDYGYHHPYIFKKHSPDGLHVYYNGHQGVKKNSGEPLYKPLIGIGFPLRVNIFVTSFLLMHVLLAVGIILAVLGLFIPAIAAAALALVLAVFYFRADFVNNKIGQSLAFVFFRYIANAALMIGGFLGGTRLKMLYISATFDYSS